MEYDAGYLFDEVTKFAKNTTEEVLIGNPGTTGIFGVTALATLAIRATPVGWAAVGIVVGVGLLSTGFDCLYDKYKDDVANMVENATSAIKDTVGKVGSAIGNAIEELFSGIASVFA